MDSLQQSIERDGFLVPILVRPIVDDAYSEHETEADPQFYEIVSGNHRFLAAREAGMEQVPCVIVEMDDDASKRLAINLNTIHGEPSAEQFAPFLAEMSDELLRQLHIEPAFLQDVIAFDEELRERLARLEAPESVAPERPQIDSHPCKCPTCGKRHNRT